MDDFFEHTVDAATRKREREKARVLRKSSYFQNLLNKGICHYCGRKFPREQLTLDHLVPIARGGRSTRGNLVVCCKKCNSEKKNFTPVDMLLNEHSKIIAVCDDKIPFLRGVFEPYGRVKYLPGREITNADLSDANCLITRTRTRVNRELLSGTGVKFVGSATIGFDHIDTEYLAENNILWSNAPGCNSTSVMQYMTSVLLNLELPLDRMTIGVVGVGNVGSKVAAAAEAMGMTVLLNDPPRAEKEGMGKFTPLEELLEKSDVVTLHVPLDSSTRDFAGDEFFGRLKKGALFINTSRGETVVEEALKQAFKSGRVGSYVLDVWRNEPDIDPELRKNAAIATPHIAGYSTDGKANGSSMIVRRAAEIFQIPELADYYPDVVPPPLTPVISLPENDTVYGQIRAAVNVSYDVRLDAGRLAENPKIFEKLRGDYPIRREFSAYRVTGGDEKARLILSKLGFLLQ